MVAHGILQAGLVKTAHHGLLGCPRCKRRAAEYFLAPFVHRGVQRLVIDELGDKAHSISFFGADHIGAQNEPHRLLEADLACQTMHAAAQGDRSD